MKNRKMLGSFGAVLILSILVASFTMILPLQDSSADAKHNCLFFARCPDGSLKVGGHIVIHPHDFPHPFACPPPPQNFTCV